MKRLFLVLLVCISFSSLASAEDRPHLNGTAGLEDRASKRHHHSFRVVPDRGSGSLLVLIFKAYKTKKPRVEAPGAFLFSTGP